MSGRVKYTHNAHVCIQDGSEYYKLAQKFSKKFEAMYKKIDLSAGLQAKPMYQVHQDHMHASIATVSFKNTLWLQTLAKSRNLPKKRRKNSARISTWLTAKFWVGKLITTIALHLANNHTLLQTFGHRVSWHLKNMHPRTLIITLL